MQRLNTRASKMKVHLFCFFLMLLDSNAGLVSADVATWTGTEGGSVTVNCLFSFFFSRENKLFCKEDCDKGKILIQTKDNTAQKDRYSLEYVKMHFGKHYMCVTITNLTKSDSGWYMCRLEGIFLNSNEKIMIMVRDASTTAEPSSSAVTTTSAMSQSLSSTPFKSTSSQTTSQSEIETLSTGPSTVLMYVGLILVGTTTILSVAVLVFCRNRASKPKASPENPEENEMVNHVYEEVRDEDRHSRCPPAEDLIIYSLVQYTEANRSDGDCGASEHKDDGGAESVIYATVPPAYVSSVSHNEDASFPLYSTDASHLVDAI